MPLPRMSRAFLAPDSVRAACQGAGQEFPKVMHIWLSTSRRLGAQTLILWRFALRLEHAQEDARIRTDPGELLRIVACRIVVKSQSGRCGEEYSEPLERRMWGVRDHGEV